MKIGYARVSTDDQTLDLQRDALNAAGCERLFEDKASGAKADRPGLAEALAFTRKGDALVVWRLDRLGRSLPELVRLASEWLPLTNAVELVRPLFMDRWPEHALRHGAVLCGYTVAAFWLALALTRKRFRG